MHRILPDCSVAPRSVQHGEDLAHHELRFVLWDVVPAGHDDLLGLRRSIPASGTTRNAITADGRNPPSYDEAVYAPHNAGWMAGGGVG